MIKNSITDQEIFERINGDEEFSLIPAVDSEDYFYFTFGENETYKIDKVTARYIINMD